MVFARVFVMSAYVELQVTSNFSFLRGASHPEELMEQAYNLDYPLLGITDRNSLAGIVRMHGVAKHNKMRIVVGCRLDLMDGYSLLAYPMTKEAYHRLSELLTIGMRRAEKGECELYKADVYAIAQDMKIVVCSPEKITPEFAAMMPEYKKAFGNNFYIAGTHYYRGNDLKRIAWIDRLAKQNNCKMVATNDVHYHDVSRREVQDLLTCVREKCTIQNAGFKLFGNAERHLKTSEEMQRLFAEYPDAIKQTRYIASACQFSLDELKYEYPDEITSEGRTVQEELEFQTWAGVRERFPDGKAPRKVIDVINKEFELIKKLEYAPYFLTVYDIVKFAKSRGILCQGRGSAANSAVCFYLGITSVDPSKLDLLFERFVSVGRNEPPDIDVDFEHERREEVIQYIFEKYGRDRAAIVANVNTYRQRGAIRDFAKAMGLSLDIVEKLAETVWRHSLEFPTPDMLRELGFDPNEPILFKTMQLISEIMGFPRHLSQHCGGFVISRDRLSKLSPIMNARMARRTCIEWDKNDIDQLGFMKIDVLSLGMLTAIRKGFDLIEQHYGKKWTLATIPQDEPETYAMISTADTIGCFQVESRAQMVMLPKLKPTCYYDLVKQVAVVRPGPIQADLVNRYLARRRGKEPVEFASPLMEKILGRTLGLPLFQEQAMQIAIEAADFTADEANSMRKSIERYYGKDIENPWQDRFINAMVINGYKRDYAELCWRHFQAFASYGFPESHAASFAHLVYCSAWIKCNYHDAFTCGIMNSLPMGFYLPSQLEQDARKAGVTVRPIDVNYSDWDCTLEEKVGRFHALRLGFRNIRGVQFKHIEKLVANRRDGYADLAAIWQRAKISKKALECLAYADAFQSIGLSRRDALWQIKGLGDAPLSLFDAQPNEGIKERKIILPKMTKAQEVIQDYAHTGVSLKGHPIEFLRDRLDKLGAVKIKELATLPDGKYVTIAGLPTHRQAPETAKGVVFITLEDESGKGNCIVSVKVKEQYRREIMSGSILTISGQIQRDESITHVIARSLDDISYWMNTLKQPEQMSLPLLVSRADEVKHGRVGSNKKSTEIIKSRDFK